jgi:hypothetical protein
VENSGRCRRLALDREDSGRVAVADFVNEFRAMVERLPFEVGDIWAGETRAVIFDSLAPKLKRTGKIIEPCFAIVRTVAEWYSALVLLMFSEKLSVEI